LQSWHPACEALTHHEDVMHRLLTAGLLAFLIPTAVPAAEPARRPNVLIVKTDDQGLGDFSFTGNPVLKTPNFDAFAKESVRLTDFHVCTMCSPTRGQLMTGLSALRNGATSVTAGRTFLRPGIPTLAGVFAKAGFQTGIFGKWHLGDSYPHRPMDKGFQECAYHLGWGLLQSTAEFDWPLVDGRYFHNGTEKRFKGHCTDLWFDAATAWVKDRLEKGEPFLCYLPTNAPHAPHIELDEYVKPYQGKGPARFFGMIAHLDKRFGDLEKFLCFDTPTQRSPRQPRNVIGRRRGLRWCGPVPESRVRRNEGGRRRRWEVSRGRPFDGAPRAGRLALEPRAFFLPDGGTGPVSALRRADQPGRHHHRATRLV
jgi:arylsulfatase A-like enzyme